MEALHTVTCDPMCGFSVTSHNQKELIGIVKTHSKTIHNTPVTDQEVKKMIKSS